MLDLTTTGKLRWQIDVRAMPAVYPHLDGPCKGVMRSAPRTMPGSAVAAAIFISAQGARRL